MKNFALAFELDLDDELSQYYWRKDMDKFRKRSFRNCLNIVF